MMDTIKWVDASILPERDGTPPPPPPCPPNNPNHICNLAIMMPLK